MSRRILVAEDSTTIQKVIRIAFSRHEVEIQEAASLLEALTCVARNRPDLLIIDASLPGVNAPEDITKVGRDTGGLPVIVLIGSYEGVDENRYKEAGFQHLLRRPFESADLIRLAAELIPGGLALSETAATTPPAGDRARHATVIMTGGIFPGGAAPVPAAPVAEAESDEETVPFIPPPPVVDRARKGQRAFEADERSGAKRGDGGPAVPVPPPGGHTVPPAPRAAPAGMFDLADPSEPADESMIPPYDPSLDPFASPEPPAPIPPAGGPGRHTAAGPDLSVVERLIERRLPEIVKVMLEDYCHRHFKGLATEVVLGELRRLAEEKARHLVDN